MDYVNSSLPIIENNMSRNGPLDKDISIEEVKWCIKRAKNGKAAGPDKIRNEMIKSGDHEFQEILRYIFNKILRAGVSG